MATDDAPQTVEPPNATANAGAATPAVTATAAAFDQAILTILPVYGLAHGLDERAITTALAIMVVGNILFQVPIGAAADRHGPRRMMVLLCLLTILGAGLPRDAEAAFVRRAPTSRP